MTNEEALLIDIKFQLDMYGSGQGSAEDTLTRVREIIFSPSLTDNQQVVLNQLCQIFMKQSYKSKMQAVYIFINKGMSDEFLRLDRNESNQVLAAFAEWGMKQEEKK